MGVFLVVVEEMRPLLVQKFSRLRRKFTSAKIFRAFGTNLLPLKMFAMLKIGGFQGRRAHLIQILYEFSRAFTLSVGLDLVEIETPSPCKFINFR
jgi:hypothetical protein